MILFASYGNYRIKFGSLPEVRKIRSPTGWFGNENPYDQEQDKDDGESAHIHQGLPRGPQYEMKAQASEAFPTRRRFYSLISAAPLLQRSFSPCRDLIKVVAVLIFFLVLAD